MTPQRHPRPRRTARWFGALVAVLLAAVTSAAAAQTTDEPPARALAGVLKRIKDAGVVHLGVREAAVPFSSIAASGEAQGYSIDLCREIVDDLASAVGVATLRIEYRRVTPSDRIEQVVDGRVDLECGATTNTAERRRRVAFSPPIYVAGTQLLVKRGSAVRSLRDLKGRTVAVVRDTSNADVMRRWAAGDSGRFTVVEVDDYATGLARVASGQVPALAADDILLAGYLAERRVQRDFAIVGQLLSYDPYGIMYARDDAALAEVVDTTFQRLARTRDIRAIYNRWFVRPLPSGVRLGLPMSAALEASFETLGLPPE